MVYLDSLELFNFKSFAKKTKICFDKNITLIVGPNGSGKSNIIDALIWVLGEREAKSLRLQKSGDIIFSSKEERDKFNLAWVAANFVDSQGGGFQLKRKITKEGNSTFYLNNKQIALKDVLEFLAKKRISTKGTNIIRQGEANKILQVDDFRRKLMVEDILGVKVFQLKKHQAELKLRASENNLSQAKNLLEEILPLRRSLKWQISRYQKREEIERKLKENELAYFFLKYSFLLGRKDVDLSQEKKKIEEEIKSLEEEISFCQKSKEKSQEREEKIQEKFSLLQKKKNSLNQEKNELLRKIGRLEGIIESQEKQEKEGLTSEEIKIEKSKIKNFFSFLKEKISSLKEIKEVDLINLKINEILTQIEKIKSELFFNQERERDKEAKKEELNKEREILQKKIDFFNQEEKKLNQEISQIEREIEESRRENQSWWQKITDLKEKLFLKRKKIDELIFQEKSFHYQKESFLEELRESGWQFEEFEVKFKNWQKNYQEKKIDLDKGKIDSLKREILKLRSQLASIGQFDESIIKQGKEVEERYQFLKKQIEDLEKTKEDLKLLIRNLTKEIDYIFSEGVKRINQELKEIFKATFPHSFIKLNLVKLKKEVDFEKEAILTNRSDENDSLEEEETVEGLRIQLNWKGKNINNLDILSGGEKALLAIVILMAIAKSFSPPFIVLDEVDAALDDENSEAVANIFIDLAKRSQLIIISHNQNIIKTANILYGVAMDSSHSSKIISYKLPTKVEL